MPLANTTHSHNRFPSSKHFLLLYFTLFAVLVAMSGVLVYHYQKRSIIKAAQTNLTMLANLKSQQIGYWRQARIGNARMLMTNQRLLHNMQHYFVQPKPKIKQQIIQALRPALEANKDIAIILIDNRGNTLLHVGDLPHKQQHIDQQHLQLTIQQRQALFGKITHVHDDPHPHITDHRLNLPHFHMTLLIPLYHDNDSQGEIFGAMAIIINPNNFLLPLATSWPVPSASAESVLIRKLDDKIQRLTPVRFSKDSNLLCSRKPPAGVVTAGSYIQQDNEGLLDGYDYRRIAVFAMVKRVPNAPWFIVAKINRVEVLQPLTALVTVIIATCCTIITGAWLMLWLWWKRQQAVFQASQYQQQILQRTLSKRLDNLTLYANDIILLCNTDGIIIDANERAIESYGYPLEELQRTTMRSLCDITDAKCDQLWEQLDQDEGVRFDSMQFRNDGTTFPVEISARWIDIDGIRLLQAIIRDISDRKEAERLLTHQAQHDPLTGLPNRTLATDRLQQAVAKGQRNNTQTALLFLDLDHFKKINDTLGHPVGDKLLITLAERIQKTLRNNDTVARFGGDEFIVLVEEIHDIDNIAILANKLITTISKPILIDQHELYVTTSVGISVSPDDSMEVDQLIRFADTAMYQAKDLGRNNFQFYTRDMNAHTHERLQLETSLRKALDRHELVVYYQPQIDIVSGQITGSEALVRWQHPEQGLIPPNNFIPIAEETGLIHPIGEWVLKQACKQNVLWQQQGFPKLNIAVNLSARQFLDKNLSHKVFDILLQTGLKPQQ
ncbi:MAG: diguanylate cyclase, partial [Thermodesulfobacteriota bacterium]|nr:diguanylate cyclase [Thermodesulfobacteriota bacterium]